MLKNPKISIIVPVFNTEEYLPMCLSSLINQTYENLEIICVNDGSVDNSLSVLQEFAFKDERIRVVGQANQGQSAARNKGLKVASGDYISFIDSDDWVSLTLYQTFVNAISNCELDVFIFNAQSYSTNPNKIFPWKFFDTSVWDGDFSNEKIYTFHNCNNPFYGNLSVCNKIYNKKFLNRIEAKFLENTIFEDQLFHMETFLQSSSIKINDEPFYKYRISNLKSTMQTIGHNVFDIFIIIEKMDLLIKNLGLYEEFKYALFQYKYVELIMKLAQVGPKYQEEFKKQMVEVLILAKDNTLDEKICAQLKDYDKYQKIISRNFD